MPKFKIVHDQIKQEQQMEFSWQASSLTLQKTITFYQQLITTPLQIDANYVLQDPTTGEVVANVYFLSRDGGKTIEMGYNTNEKFRGKNIAPDLCNLALADIYQQSITERTFEGGIQYLPCEKVFMSILDSNKASEAVAMKLGCKIRPDTSYGTESVTANMTREQYIKQQKIKQAIDGRLDELGELATGVNTDWVYDFANFLQVESIPDEAIKTVLNKILEPKNIENMKNAEFLTEKPRKKQMRSFVRYLFDLKKENKTDYILKGIQYAIDNTSETGNFFDSFIRYCAITNYSDIQIVSTIPELNESNDAYVGAFLGGLELCHNKNIAISEETGNVQFEWFHTRDNMQGLKLGKQVLIKLIKDVAEYHKGRDVSAENVQKRNTGALRFYVANGGQIYDLESRDIIDISQVNPEEKGNVGVFYDKSRFAKIIAQKIVPPELDDGLHTNLTETLSR